MKNLLLIVSFILKAIVLPAQNSDLEKYAVYFNKDLQLWKTSFTNFKLADFKRQKHFLLKISM